MARSRTGPPCTVVIKLGESAKSWRRNSFDDPVGFQVPPPSSMNKHISHYYQPSPRSLKRQHNWKGMGIKLFLSALEQLEWGWRGWICLVGRKALLGNRCAIESSIPSFVPTFSGISCNWTRATDCFVGQFIRTFGTAYCPDFADEGRHFRCTSDNAIVHRGWFYNLENTIP